LCNLEKCNYPCLANGFCKKHNIKDTEQICENCLVVEEKENFIENNKTCKKCREKVERQSPDYKSIVTLKNGIRYKTFPNAGTRKLCQLGHCSAVASGEFCRKHKVQTIRDDEKQCHRCLTVKPLTEFQKDDTTYEKCVNCRKYGKESSSIRHQDRRKFLLQIKIDMGGKCVDCGIEDLEVLEFDHITDDKLTEVRKISNYQGMLDEAKKCTLRCCTCHLIKTKASVVQDTIDESNNKPSVVFCRTYRDNARRYVHDIKVRSNGCVECRWFDVDNLQVLHFDHIDENDKEHNIARLVSTGRSIELIQSEINKTRLLCGNCHRKRTLRQFNYPVLELIENLQ
jgi:hypothetical protein